MSDLTNLRKKFDAFEQLPNLPYLSPIERTYTSYQKLPSGDVYTGEWDPSKNCADGEGLLFMVQEGLVYEGRFIAGERSTYGRAIFLNGDSYLGRWRKDAMEGDGKFTSLNGKCVFEGQFMGGVKHGSGKETFKSGDIFEGEYAYDKR